MARIGKGVAAVLLIAAGAVIITARSKPAATSLPAAAERIIRRHVSGDDFEGYAGALREHVAAGRPVTQAALAALASVWFEPSAITAIKRELQAAGLL